MLQSAANHSYSWWWDSHISPKHSRWLQENLTDMDLKVKDMLKLIEEDADSFSKRAEMYYKKRPELISLVEEFYRAYRALAERYDHITGELHQVQYSMAEAFPNQHEYKVDSDSPQVSSVNGHSQSPQVKEIEGFGAFVKEAGHQSLQSRETTQSLHYSEDMEKEILNQKRGSYFLMHKRTGSPSGETEAPNEIAKLHKEILSLQQEKETLKRDCERGVQQCRVLEKQAMQMQEELYNVKEETHKVNEDSLSYLAQIDDLKEQVCTLKKQNNDYAQDCNALRHELQSETQEQRELITEMRNLDGTLHKSEKLIEVQHKLPTPEHETDGSKFANLQDKLSKLQHENHNLIIWVMTGVQCLQKAEEEAKNLHQALSKSQAENDTMIFQYQESLKLYEAAENRNKDLQVRISLMQEENRRIKDEMSAGALHMKIIEEKVQNLEREKNVFQQEIWHRIQRANLLQEGILAKHNDEQNLNMRPQDDIAQILRFDTALRNCQLSLSQSQEQQRRLTAELQERNERLKDTNKRIKFLEEEVHHSQGENNKLMEKSSSLVMSIKNLEQEVYRLKQDKTSLLNEVAFRVDQRDALQQELYCLQEDRNDLDRRSNTIMKQIQSLGFDPESLHSSFVSLQNVSQKLREHCQIGGEENITVPKIVQKMEELINENIALENAVSSHHLGEERLQFEMRLLQQQVQGLQDEKVAMVIESEQHNEHVRALEAKLQNAHNLCSQLCRENQQLKDKFTDELGCMKHLKEQVCNLQKEKEALENEIAECYLQVSYSKKEVHLLQEEGKDLKDKLQREIEKGQVLRTEIEDLQQLLCQMDHRNQILSDDCQKHIGRYNDAEEKLMEREKLILVQQAENAMLQHNLSSEKQLNKELELEIDKVESLLSVPNNSQGKSASDDVQDAKLLNGIIKEVRGLQMKLLHLQHENKLLLDDASAQNANLEQHIKDMSVLHTEKESIEEEAAIRLQYSVDLHKEISQLHEAAEVLRIQLAAGVEREINMDLEIKNLQQSLTNSLSAHSLVEDEYQRMLEDYSSTKAHIKESQSMLSEMEQENQTLILDILAQISLATMLESHIVQKDEKIQLLEEQLSCLQENNAKLENELQNSATKVQMQGAESQLLQKSVCSSQDSKGQPVPYLNEFQRVHGELDQQNFQIQTGVECVQEEDNTPGGLGEQLEAVEKKNEWLVKVSPRQEYAIDEMTGKEFQQQISMLKEDNIHYKLQIPVGCETELEGPLNGLNGERQIAGDEISSPVQANESQAEVRQLQQGKVLDVEVERLHEALQSSKFEKTLLKDGHRKHIDGCKNLETSSWVFQEKLLSKENKNCKQGTEKAYKNAQIEEPEVIVGDLEAEKQIMETEASSIFTVTAEQNVCSFKAQNMQFLAHLEPQGADIRKLQDHWLKWFQDDIGKLQEMNRALNNELQIVANEMLKVQPEIPLVHQIKKELEEMNQSLKDECQQRIKELCNIWAKLEDIKHENTQLESVNRSLEAEQEGEEDKILQLHKDERMFKDEIPLQANDMETLKTKIESAKEVKTQKMEIKLEGLQIPSVVSYGLKAKSEEVQDVEPQIAEFQAKIRDLQQENIQLKGIWQNSADDIKMEMKEELPHDLPQAKGQDLSMMIVEGHLEYQEEKEVLVDEFKGRENMEARVRHDIDLLQEETRKFWTRFDSATQQIQKLQNAAQDLQVKFWKPKQDKKKLKDDQWTRIEYNTIEKQLRELQDDLLIWLEHNGLQTKEVQHRFASVNRIEQEIAALKGGHSGNNNKTEETTVNQTGYLQAEISSMQGQIRKAADMLQAGSDQARGLEFEVERILLRLQQEMETSTAEIQKKTYIQRVRIPLKAFFGKKEREQKQWPSCTCLRLPTHE